MQRKDFNTNNPVTHEATIEIAYQILIRKHEPSSLPQWFLKCAILNLSKNKDNDFIVSYSATMALTLTGEAVNCFSVAISKSAEFFNILTGNILDIKPDDIEWPNETS